MDRLAIGMIKCHQQPAFGPDQALLEIAPPARVRSLFHVKRGGVIRLVLSYAVNVALRSVAYSEIHRRQPTRHKPPGRGGSVTLMPWSWIVTLAGDMHAVPRRG